MAFRVIVFIFLAGLQPVAFASEGELKSQYKELFERDAKAERRRRGQANELLKENLVAELNEVIRGYASTNGILIQNIEVDGLGSVVDKTMTVLYRAYTDFLPSDGGGRCEVLIRLERLRNGAEWDSSVHGTGQLVCRSPGRDPLDLYWNFAFSDTKDILRRLPNGTYNFGGKS